MEIVKTVTADYEKGIKLSQKEKEAVVLLIEATYAAYFFRTAVLIAQGDDSEETKEWSRKAEKLLGEWRRLRREGSLMKV